MCPDHPDDAEPPVRLDLIPDPRRRPAPDADGDDDLTRALDGWGTSGAPGRSADPTRLLDGWGAPAGPAPRLEEIDLSIDLGVSPRAPVQPADTAIDLAALQADDDDGITDVVDLKELRLDATPPATPAEAAAPAWQPGALVAGPRGNARVIAQWKPGAWVGAVHPVFGAVSDIVSTPNGPVVDMFPPHVLLALWPPQGLAQPFLSRFPLRVQLSAVEPEQAGDVLLACMPEQAELWLAPQDIDWAFVADLVLHHDRDLRPFQVRELKAYIDREREALYTRLNRGYTVPAPGQPLLRTEDAAAGGPSAAR